MCVPTAARQAPAGWGAAPAAAAGIPKAGTAAAKQAAAARPEGVTTLTAKRLSEISMTEEKSRILTGISELDRVLGGGIVLGGVVLLSGEPGVGKSVRCHFQPAQRFVYHWRGIGAAGQAARCPAESAAG